MYDGIKLFLEWVGYFFIAYLIGYSTFLFLSVVVGSLELYKHRRQEMFKSILPSDYYLPISIIVPAYNEEVTVADTVRSLLALDYRSYEIIVVDDGSKDRTSEVLAETFDMHLVHRPIRRQINCQREEYVYETRAQKVPVTLIRKKNGGKADALNMGINAANFPYFICMDADSVLQYDSLRRIAQPILENGNVVAVGGIVRISNDVELENGRVKHYRLPRNILAFMQVLEYDRSFLASRILFDRFNGSLIISGAFGLFKKDTVIAVFSTQEEVGLRGAKTAAYGVEPDVGIALDVTANGDTPEDKLPAVKLGEGICVKIMDRGSISNPELVRELLVAGEKAGVPTQREVLPFGGTDAGAMQLTRGGVRVCTLSIPCRNVHSACEVIDLRDVDGGKKLLLAYLER